LVDNEQPEREALAAAIRDARRRFVFIEVGAGYGRWTRAASEAATAAGLDAELVAVEAEPGHFADLQAERLPARLVNAAVSRRDGWTLFAAGIDGCYGQRIIDRPRLAANWLRRGGRIRRVRTVSLDSLVEPYDRVDLVDLDVQGAEADILEHADLSRIRRVHVGTHSRPVETRLRSLFSELGWECEHDFPGEAEHGGVWFEDGAQTWASPALRPVA